MTKGRVSVVHDEKVNCEDGDADDVALDNLAMKVVEARKDEVDKKCENEANQANTSTDGVDRNKNRVFLSFLLTDSKSYIRKFLPSRDNINSAPDNLGDCSPILPDILYTVVLSESMQQVGQAAILCNLVIIIRL